MQPAPRPPDDPAAQATQWSGLICTLLVLVTLVVYWPVRNFDFVGYDDADYVTENPHVLGGLTLGNVAWAFQTDHASNWHPLTWLSHMLDVSLFGKSADGPHITNLLLHAANAALLFLLLNRLTGARWRSAMVAALFALHPLHVESVAWISERKDVLSTFFGLLAILAYVGYAESKINHEEANHYRWLAPALFAGSLMCKPMLVTLPFLLLLLDYWPLGRWGRTERSGTSNIEHRTSNAEHRPAFAGKLRPGKTSNSQLPGAPERSEGGSTLWQLVREKGVWFGLSAASCLITYWVQAKDGAVQPLAEISLGARIANALVSYARYLGKTVWPVNLAVLYPYQGHWSLAAVAGAALLLAGISAAVIWSRRRAPFALMGWLWFLGALVPAIGLVQVGVQSMADRYSYVPVVGVFILLSWGAVAAWERYRLPKAMAGVVAALVLGACAAATRGQLSYWENTGTLFGHTLAVTRDNYTAHDVLGFYLFRTGRAQEAMEHYHEALRINPRDYKAYDDLGFAQFNLGKVNEAITNYARALQLNPRYPNCLNNLGTALMSKNQYAEAIAAYREALKLDPDYADAHINLGVAWFRIGKIDEAIKECVAALQLMPDDARAHNNLANALIVRGAVDEAIAHYQFALQSDPDFLEALNNLGYVLSVKGDFADSIECYQRALKLKPDSAQLHNDFGDVLVKAGKKDEAAEEYRAALRLKPDLKEAQQALNALGHRN